jgi:exodeoxyribonuclease-3
VAPADEDVYDPEDCEGDICYHPDERTKLRALMNLGFYDGFRAVHPQKRQYTWWDLRGGAWEKGEGMRIDHLLCNAMACDRISAADADPSTRAGPGVSDHIPIWIEI